jgi:hypothetical protein
MAPTLILLETSLSRWEDFNGSTLILMEIGLSDAEVTAEVDPGLDWGRAQHDQVLHVKSIICADGDGYRLETSFSELEVFKGLTLILLESRLSDAEATAEVDPGLNWGRAQY